MTSLTQNVMRVFRPITVTDHRQRRLWNFVQSAVTSLGSRVLGMAITFFSVPLTIGYLGREEYGAWLTIGSFMAWTWLTDFGLGNGLNNAVTTAAGQDRPDLVRMHLSNGMVIMALIAGGFALLLALAWPYVDWADALGVSGSDVRAEIGPAVAAALGIFLLGMPLSMAGKVYQAYQQGRIGNYWGIAANVLSFAALIVVTKTGGGLVWLVFAVSGTPLVVSVANNAYVFTRHRPELRPHWRYVDRAAMRTVGQVGSNFFLIQILSLITYQTDNIVIDRFLGASAVPEYSLTYSLFSYASLPISTVFPYLWVAYTEAMARKDVAWVRHAFRLHLVASVSISVAASAVLVVIARPFMGFWAGEALVPSIPLVWWMAAWTIISGFINPLGCLLAAASHLKMQTVFAACAAVVNMAMSLLLVPKVGVTGVIAGTVVSYTMFQCGPLYILCRRLLKRLTMSHEGFAS